MTSTLQLLGRFFIVFLSNFGTIFYRTVHQSLKDVFFFVRIVFYCTFVT